MYQRDNLRNIIPYTKSRQGLSARAPAIRQLMSLSRFGPYRSQSAFRRRVVGQAWWRHVRSSVNDGFDRQLSRDVVTCFHVHVAHNPSCSLPLSFLCSEHVSELQTAANAHLFSHMPESDDLLHFLSVCRVHLIYFCVLNYFCRQLMIHGSSHFITKLQHEFFLLISIVLFHLVLTILVV